MSTATLTDQLTELAGTYTIDPTHSRVGFMARHAMVTKVRGHFTDFTGTFTIDANDPTRSTAEVTIQAHSVDTNNADRDAHLKSNDFFAMDEHPTISFTSSNIEQVDETTFRLTGELTLRGVTRPVTLDLEYTGAVIDPWDNTRVGFEGSTVVNRRDFDLTWNATLDGGGVLVSDKVTLEFDISATRNA